MPERDSLGPGQVVPCLFWPHLPPSHLPLGSGAGGEGGEAARFTPLFKGASEGGVSSPSLLSAWQMAVPLVPGRPRSTLTAGAWGRGRRCGPSCQGLRLPGPQPPPQQMRTVGLGHSLPLVLSWEGLPGDHYQQTVNEHPLCTRPNSGFCGYCTGSCPQGAVVPAVREASKLEQAFSSHPGPDTVLSALYVVAHKAIEAAM